MSTYCHNEKSVSLSQRELKESALGDKVLLLGTYAFFVALLTVLMVYGVQQGMVFDSGALN
ncbi:hypothetical protein [Anaeromusa acidaminophila]|uniref:hypothetical protein n=1 Tax=Anaeromusa acidaminophila TaxID=81464 RepID=UPI00035F20A9|nr:hypothetical protein [Anaeromusa acidaminophila]